MKKVNFVIGQAGSGKTHHILTGITNKCMADPFGLPLFVITPEQMTFHTEYQLLLMNPQNSLVRANVTSFTRLAQRIMQEVGGLARYHLDEVGKAMLLQKILLDQTDDLGIFAKYVKKTGFIKKMDELFTEFKNYQLDPAMLKAKLTTTDFGTKTQQKITTLANIYEHFNEITLSQYLTTEDYFTHLLQVMGESELIKQAEIYIDGYHTFNAQEIAIITQLAAHAKQVTIALTTAPTSVYNLFSTTQKTYSRLYDALAAYNPHILQLPNAEMPVPTNQIINHIKTNFMQAGRPFTSVSNECDHFQLGVAPSRRDEIEAVATSIHRLAFEQNVAFSNIAVYSANPQVDQHLYHNIFAKFEIPHFLDLKASMLTHPVINLVHKVFAVFETNWRASSVFQVLKTGLFVDVTNFALGGNYQQAVIKNFELVDALENYVLARNFKKADWLAGNVQNTEIVQPLIEFEIALVAANTMVEYATAVISFLETLAIPKKLQLMIADADASSQLQVKKQHEQVWPKLLNVFEQLVEVGGKTQLTQTDFALVLAAGLEQLTFATVPPTLDAVQIGDITRSRHQLVPNFNRPTTYGIEHVFIIGANDGVLPSIPVEASLLSEKERQILTSLDIELAPSLITSQQDEVFSLYTILATAQKSISISYSNEDSGQPSYIFTHLAQIFPQIQVRPLTVTDPYDCLTTKNVLIDKTLFNLRLNQHQKEYYQPAVDYIKRSESLQYQLMMRALGYDNGVQPLSVAQTTSLYGEQIEASVSRLELFNNCQFAHFMNYGLRLKERDLFQLEIADIGTLFHEVLKYIALQLRKQQRGFASLSDNEIKTLTKLGVAAVVKKEAAFQIFKSSPRMQQLVIKLEAVVMKTVFTLAKQGKMSDFKETYFEMRFGKDAMLKTKSRQIGATEFSLKGVIDRIDIARNEHGKRFLRVVDYKSSKRELELDAVYYGLSLQLLTYLDVALTNLDGEYDNAGALYFHVHNPYTQINEEILTDQTTLVTTAEQGQSAQYRMTGLLPQNHEVAIMSDNLLNGSRTKSDIIPVSLKKDGTFSAVGNRTLDNHDFDLLRQYTNQKISETVSLMSSGKVAINPAQHKAKTACDWCSFKAVCQFDSAYNQQRNLPKLKNDEVLTMMKS